MKKKNVGIILFIVLFLCGGLCMFSLFNEIENNDDIVTVACVGDSLTRREISLKENARCDYPTILKELLGENYEVTNYGVAGTCVQIDLDAPYRNTSKYTESVEAEADILIIMLGSNDIWYGGLEKEDAFYKQYSELLDSYLQSENTSKIYLCTLPTSHVENQLEFGEGEVADLKKASAIIRRIAKEEGCAVIEMNEITSEHPEWYDEDKIHFNNYGAEGIAEIIYQSIINGEQNEE